MVDDGVYHVVRRDGYRVRFLLGADDDVRTVDDVDVYVDLDDGSTWVATVMTLDAIARVMDRWSRTGEELGGSYFQCPDLVVTREAGVAAITALVDGLRGEGELPEVFRRLESDAD